MTIISTMVESIRVGVSKYLKLSSSMSYLLIVRSLVS